MRASGLAFSASKSRSPNNEIKPTDPHRTLRHREVDPATIT
jgi:hypothetical protein